MNELLCTTFGDNLTKTRIIDLIIQILTFLSYLLSQNIRKIRLNLYFCKKFMEIHDQNFVFLFRNF